MVRLPSFQDRNLRLKKKVELWYFASQLGVSPDYSHHLHMDHSFRELGFEEDVSLCLAQSDKGNMSDPLELLDQSCRSCLKHVEPVKHQGMFAMFSRDGMAYV